MYRSLIQIGSKTAEKNSAQTNRQTDRQTNRHYENNGHLAVNRFFHDVIGTNKPWHKLVLYGPTAHPVGKSTVNVAISIHVADKIHIISSYKPTD